MGSTVKQPSLSFWRGGDLHELGLACKAELLQLIADEAAGQAGAVDGQIELLQQIGDAADVILMAVGDEQALDLILVLHHKSEIWDNHVHAVHVAVREHKAAVHDDHVAVALVHGHVLAHFAQTAQRVDVDGHSGLLGLLRTAGPPVIIRAAGAGTLFPAGFTVSVRIVLSLSRVLFFDLCHAVPPKSITKRRHTPLRAACLL